MITKAQSFRSIGWMALLAVCIALVMVLAFRVNALRSQVKRTEDKIIALRLEQSYLQLEFQTRASQQQLRDWNTLEFGYAAPTAGQYLENERQLAQFARPDAPGAPVPIRVASLDDTVAANAAFPALVSPLTGKPAAAEAPAGEVGEGEAAPRDHGAAKAALGARLARVSALPGADDAAEPAARPAKDKPARALAAAAKPKVLADAKSAGMKPARMATETRSYK
ncbi:hypothetical protein [Novosphingobium sp. Chol11]|uniref:hypothetical protein n=1 Tax=Novosphingobium sp. Chol11 TaxID=1385763 RepID=UPI0025DD93F0|nr:hypothetical protein [Novosphingobium sp. Chol11]